MSKVVSPTPKPPACSGALVGYMQKPWLPGPDALPCQQPALWQNTIQLPCYSSTYNTCDSSKGFLLPHAANITYACVIYRRFLATHCPQLQQLSCCFGSDLLYGGSLLEGSLSRLVNTCEQLTRLALLNVDVTDKVLVQLGSSCHALQELTLGRTENNAYGNFISGEWLCAAGWRLQQQQQRRRQPQQRQDVPAQQQRLDAAVVLVYACCQPSACFPLCLTLA
jgi:hypothetical protein